MRGAWLFVLLAACGDGAPIGDEPLRFDLAGSEVLLGRPFALTVVRVWERGGAAPEWEADGLRLELKKTRVREQGDRIEETRLYDACAVSLNDIAIPGLALKVRRSLDPQSPGPPELPERPARGWGWWWAGGALFLAVLFLARRRRPVAPEPVAAPEPPETPRSRALRRLAALRESDPATPIFARELAAIVRDFAGARRDWSTEELLAAAPDERLAEVLALGDRVKFARFEPDAVARGRVLDAASEYIGTGAA